MIYRFLCCFGLALLSISSCTYAQEVQGMYLDVDIWRNFDLSNDSYSDPANLEISGIVNGLDITYSPSQGGVLEAKISIEIKLTNLLLPTQAGSQYLSISNTEKDTTSRNNYKKLGFRRKIKELSAGKYLLEVYARDLQNSTNSCRYSQELIIPSPPGIQLWSSGIAFTKSYQRRGRVGNFKMGNEESFFFEPLLTNDALTNADSLSYFVQLYNVKQNIDADSFTIMSSIWKDNYKIYESSTQKINRVFNIYIDAFNIRELPTGVYHLQIELMDHIGARAKYRVDKKFYVYNSREESEFELYVEDNYASTMFNIYDENEIDYYINTLGTISSNQEKRFAKALTKLRQKRNYLYTFWELRIEKDESILDLWKGYLAVLQFVNKKYSEESREGWQTDRGKTMLRFGPPNEVNTAHGTETQRAYEQWKYSRLDNQNDIEFVFVDLGDGQKETFSLVHSNKYGEETNLQWRLLINQ